jgi:CDGSH-type Zn-finger protein
VTTGTLTIAPIPNGPNRCDGPLTIQDIDGREASAMTTFLCRCGGSRRKPYCDGIHKKNGFAA